MNCPNHPELPASQRCTVCAGYFCSDCAPPHRFLEEPVCPTCTPELTRQLMTAGSSPSNERRKVAPRAGVLFLGAALLALGSVLVSKVVLPGLGAAADDVQREALLVAAFAQVGEAIVNKKRQLTGYIAPSYHEEPYEDFVTSPDAAKRPRTATTSSSSVASTSTPSPVSRTEGARIK